MLGLVHGGVGVPQEFVDTVVFFVADDHADAGGRDHLVAAQLVGLVEGLEQALGHGHGVFFAVDAVE